jgi:acyl-CoA synthetase (AMP-forming)/AMP-acid ligase II
MTMLPPRSDTLIGALAHAVEQGGVGARFVDRHERADTWRFDELWSRAKAAAGALTEAGTLPGDRVIIVSPTQVEFYDAFFGALMAGAIPTPVYPPVRLGKLDEWVERTAQLVESVGAAAIVGDRRSRRLLGQVVGRASVPLGVLKLEELHTHEPLLDVASPRPDDIVLIQFSSGTTRTPAAVTLTHRQVLANIEAIVESLPDEALSGGGCVSWLPLYHDMGLIGCLLTTLRVGQPMTLIPPEVFLMKPAIWLRTLSRYRGTVSPAPNFAYARAAEKIDEAELEGVDLSGWVVAMNGAEPIAVSAMERFAARFGRFGLRESALTPVYGLAEAALAVTFSDFTRPYEAREFDRDALGVGRAEIAPAGLRLPSLGRPLPGYAVEIRAADGDELPDGQVGAVWVRGPSITSGYYDGATPTVGGWLDTGDLGFLFEGELYVTGRAKDVVVVRGRNHAPFDIERACDEVSGVRTGCSVAVSELSEQGEYLHLCVESRAPTPALADACREAVRRRVGVTPDAVHVVEAGTLPRTSSGKLRRRAALMAYLQGELNAPAEVGAVHLATHMAKSAFGYLKR